MTSGPADPFAITVEELERRIPESLEAATFRAVLVEHGLALPLAKLTVDSLLEMEGLPQLELALSVLTREELRRAFSLFLYGYYKALLDEDAFAVWEAGGCP